MTKGHGEREVGRLKSERLAVLKGDVVPPGGDIEGTDAPLAAVELGLGLQPSDDHDIACVELTQRRGELHVGRLHREFDRAILEELEVMPPPDRIETLGCAVADDEALPDYGLCRVPMEGTDVMAGVDFDELAATLSMANPLSLFGDPLDAEVRARRSWWRLLASATARQHES